MRACVPCLLVLLSLALVACRSSEAQQNLLNAIDFAPKEADVGDRLELVGMGFPEGKPATLTFRGSLFRPGREATHDVEIVAAASSTSQNRISLVLNEELYASFVGRGHGARHTTFHGEVIGAFAPRTRGAPPVTGSVSDVVLDLAAPPTLGDHFEADVQEGKRLLEFTGITLDSAHKQRLVVQALRAGGRGERAGLEPGDALLEFDGVRVQGTEDLIPSGKRRTAELLVQHGRLRDPLPRTLDVEGFRAAAPAELSPALMLIGLFAAILLLFAAPFGRVLTWAERRAASRLQSVHHAHGYAARRSDVPRLAAASFFRSVLATGQDTPLVRLVLYLSFLGSTLALTLLAFGRALVLPELELILLFVASLTAVAVMALILGGARDASRWSLWAGLKNAGLVVSCQLPAFIAVLCVVLVSGSLRLRDMVWAQGGAPWHWHAFRNPSLLIMFLLFMASAVPEASRSALDIPELDSERRRAEELRRPVLRVLTFFAEWTGLLVSSAVAAILFLGGWQLPFLRPGEQQEDKLYQALGAVLVVSKCWGLTGVVLFMRWLLPDMRAGQVVAFFWRWLIPAALVGACSSLLWTYGLENSLLHELSNGFGSVLFALVMFVLGYFIRRVAYAMRGAYAHVNVNPWL